MIDRLVKVDYLNCCTLLLCCILVKGYGRGHLARKCLCFGFGLEKTSCSPYFVLIGYLLLQLFFYVFLIIIIFYW